MGKHVMGPLEQGADAVPPNLIRYCFLKMSDRLLFFLPFLPSPVSAFLPKSERQRLESCQTEEKEPRTWDAYFHLRCVKSQ